MRVLALVDVDAATARRLESVGDVRRCAAGPDMDTVLALVRDRLDVVVVGQSVTEPVQIVQRAHRLGAEVGVVLLLNDAATCAKVTAALQTAPFVGADVRCVDVSREDAVAEVNAAADRARKRRAHRAVSANLNLRLASAPAGQRPSPDVMAAALLEFAPVGIAAIDAQARITSVNREASRLIGEREIDLLGRSLAALPADAPTGWIDELTSAEAEPPRLTLRDKTGAERIVEVRGAKGGDGADLAFVALTDVTRRVRAEDAREAARRDAENARRALETTLRSIGDAVIATDSDGRVTMMNPVAEELTGWPESEACGQPLDTVFRIVNEETRATVESPVAKVLREGVIVGLANHTILIARDASERPIDDSAAPIRDVDGRIHGVVLVFRSVADAKRQEQRRAALVEATAALTATLDYRQALAALANIFVPRFADWCVIDLADAGDGKAELVAVVHRDEAMAELGRELRAKHRPPERDPLSVRRVLATGESIFVPSLTREALATLGVAEDRIARIEMLGLRSAMIVPLVGRDRILGAITIAYAESGRKYTDDDRAFVEDFARRIGSVVDNARLFAAEQRARAAADVANRAKDEFLATVSHELRTPLNAILGWSRMIAAGRMAAERQQSALESIERNAIAMAQLIDDLLDVSRIVSGKLRLEPDWIDPLRAIEGAVDAVRPGAVAKDITIRTVFDSAASIFADPNRLQQIVWNLLTNAIKFTPKGGRVDVVLRRADSNVELTVRDSGAGIDSSFLPHVFDPFRQADGTSTRKHGGLGLGLAITRHLVELHGGAIEARSEGEGHGATFIVRLPIAAVRPQWSQPERVTTRSLEPAVPMIDLSGVHVLAVDDDADARELVRESLALAGARVESASTAREAFEKLTREPPDVLVSDIGMPDEDGYALITKVRALPADAGGIVPAAALTAYTRGDDRKKVLAAGFTLHLAKPIDPAELVTAVATLARMSRGR